MGTPPTDTSRCIKLSLEGLCRKGPDGNILPEASEVLKLLREMAPRMSALVTETWRLINLDFRERCERSLCLGIPHEEPKWTMARVLTFMKAVSTTSSNRAKDGDPLLIAVRKRLYDPLRTLLPLISREGIPCNSLQEASKKMAAAINTNVREHWYKRQRRYLAVRDNMDKKTAWDHQREINSAAGSGPTNDDSLPPTLLKSVGQDLASNPERFLWRMWCINSFLERHGYKKVCCSASLPPVGAGCLSTH
jgi:hypothetical protein